MANSHWDDPSLVSKLKAEYDKLSPSAERLRHELTRQIQALIDGHRIALGFPIESRVKSWDSVESKVKRLSLGLESIIQLQDLVGVRLVVLFRRDAEKLCSLIADTLRILKHEDTALRLKEDRFGYSSVHFLIRLPEAWLSVPSLNSLGTLTAEIQVRTMARHIWAASSHVLQYKNESNVPLPVSRSIHRVSALLETVDFELERVLIDRERYTAEINVSSEEPLNVDSLRKLLDSLLPPLNKGENENYSVLLRELNDFEVRDTGRLRQIISKHLSSTLEMDRKTAREYKEKWTGGTMRQRVDAGVYFLHVGLVRDTMAREFGRQWEKYMLGTALKYMSPDDHRRASVEKELADLTD